jgi:hypothetical protein
MISEYLLLVRLCIHQKLTMQALDLHLTMSYRIRIEYDIWDPDFFENS